MTIIGSLKASTPGSLTLRQHDIFNKPNIERLGKGPEHEANKHQILRLALYTLRMSWYIYIIPYSRKYWWELNLAVGP